MKSRLAFAVGIGVGLLLGCTVLLISHSLERDRADSEIVALKQNLIRAEQAAQGDREAMHSMRRDLETIRAAKTQSEVPTTAVPSGSPTAIPTSAAMVGYLGEPIAVPASLDPKYSAQELAAVFRDLCETLGIKIEKLAVDTTEFPFIVHGRVESQSGGDFFRKIDSELKALPGYTYGGSTTGRAGSGLTYFALNMTPASAYPRELGEAIHRRLMLRLQMVAAGLKESQP